MSVTMSLGKVPYSDRKTIRYVIEKTNMVLVKLRDVMSMPTVDVYPRVLGLQKVFLTNSPGFFEVTNAWGPYGYKLTHNKRHHFAFLPRRLQLL
jgi:hypothetical protein